jgi:hypothetical protein
METWISTAETLYRALLGNPGTIQLAVVSVAMAAALVFGLSKLADMLGVPNTSLGSAIIMAALGAVFALAAATATQLHLLPALGKGLPPVAVHAAVQVVVLLALNAVVVCILLKANYVRAVLAWIVTVIAVAVVAALATGLADATGTLLQDMLKIRDTTKEKDGQTMSAPARGEYFA